MAKRVMRGLVPSTEDLTKQQYDAAKNVEKDIRSTQAGRMTKITSKYEIGSDGKFKPIEGDEEKKIGVLNGETSIDNISPETKMSQALAVAETDKAEAEASDTDANALKAFLSLRINSAIKEQLKADGYNFLRLLYNMYRQIEKNGYALNNQIDAYSRSGRPVSPILTMSKAALDKYNEIIKRVLKAAGKVNPMTAWLMDNFGIGEMTAVGLYIMLDITKAPYAGNFISYAGYNNNNNPWLGVEKGAKLAKEAKKYSDAIIVPIVNGEKECPPELFEDCALYSENPDAVTALMCEYCANKTNRHVWDIKRGVYRVLKSNLQNKLKAAGEDFDAIDLYDEVYDFEHEFPKVLGDENIPTVEHLKSYLAMPPYNNKVKTLLFKWLSNLTNSEKNKYAMYKNALYAEYKVKNDQGFFAEEAKRLLESGDYVKAEKKHLEEGKFSKMHLLMMAYRKTAILLLNHTHEAWYYIYYGKEAPKPYVIDIMNHRDYIPPFVDYHKYRADWVEYMAKYPEALSRKKPQKPDVALNAQKR